MYNLWRDMLSGVSLLGVVGLVVAGGIYKEKIDDMEPVTETQQQILLEQRTLVIKQEQYQDDLDDLQLDIKEILNTVREER